MCCAGVARYIKGKGERNPVYADGGYQSPSNDRKSIEMAYTGFYFMINPGMVGAAYSFAGMRPYSVGQANVKSYNRQLCTLISVGKAKPSLIISHELSLGEAPEA